MDSLANYGSDDDYEDSSDERQTDWRQTDYNKKVPQRPSLVEGQADANYEEVQMDLSEESNDGSRNGKETRDSSGDDRRCRDSLKDGRGRDDYRNRRRDDRSRDRSRNRERRDSTDDDRMKEKKDDRYGSKTDKYSRDDKTRKDSYRDRKYRRSSSRERRRSNSRERRRSDSRDRRRSSSRERRSSRSPKRDRSRRSRSRSRSRGRYSGGPQRRYGYPKANVPRNDSTETPADSLGGDNKNRFFMPGITGKYREQIEKRKLLWQKKEPQKQDERTAVQVQAPASTSTSRVTKIWEATTFAQDQDGKVASKFKRLMGIKGQTESAPVPPTDIIKKQEEMFSSMEQQYEVARTATHTMRGVGLGFSSYPR